MTAIDSSVFKTAVAGLYGLALPTPFSIGPVNVYLVEAAQGEPLTLIDCGTARDESYDALRAGLASLGHSTAEVRRLILSHHHTDHVGAAGRLAADVQAAGGDLTILAHPLAVPYIETPADAHRKANRYAADFFRVQGGVPQQILESIAASDSYLLSLVNAASVTDTIDEGYRLKLAGRGWQVLHTPGHAGDQLCFFQTESRVAIVADHLLGTSKSNPLLEPPVADDQPRPKRLIEYERELQRLAALDPVLAYPGHGSPITNVNALAAERIARRQIRTEKLFGLLSEAPSEARTLYELSRRLFPHTSPDESFLTLSETLGHLDFLTQAGRIAPVPRSGGTLHWEKVEH